MGPSLLLTNGRFFTQFPLIPAATAVLIEGNRIMGVGDQKDLLGFRDEVDEWIDLGGRGVVPGLVDAHVHFQHYALSLQRVKLDAAPTRAAAVAQVAEFAAQAQPGNGWIEGRGWTQDNWPDRAFPSATDLDAILPHTPALLSHRSGHAAWVNSAALRLAQIDATTPDPPGGQIQRDAHGRPTGILFEDAINLVARLVPAPDQTTIVEAMRHAQETCWQLGLTGIHDFDGRACFTALQELHENDELGLRVVKNIPIYRLEYAIGVGLRTGFGDDWLRIGGVKMFADGALGSRTAAMLAPYEGEPDNTGIVVTDKEEMLEHALEASRHGLSVTIHAIGDRANHDVLDVYEQVRRDEATRAAPRLLRHRIEHVQILHPSDLGRLAALNVVASMQPIHATADYEMADRYWGERSRYAYAWRTMLNSGALTVFGSDAPVESISPLEGIHAAVTRRRADGAPGPDGWRPDEALSLEQAIHGFTLAAAITGGYDSLGVIAPGCLADLTIFDQDLFELPPHDLRLATVAATMVDGGFAYRTF